MADEFHSILQGIRFPRRMKIGFRHRVADFLSTAPPSIAGRPRAKQRPSFLMVGTVEMRKGHRLALDAFESMWRENIDAELVIVGKTGWCVEHLLTRLRKIRIGPALDRYEKASDDELLGHYADADALIAASYTEGFGLPLVEARHFGKPIIASDIPVFREVTAGVHSARFFEVGLSLRLALPFARS